MTVDLTDPIFNDEEAARAHFEKLRWPDGPVCPHCGGVDCATELKGKSTRPGLYKCRQCQKPFTAMIGTVYERSHIPMRKWLLATYLLCSSKKGMSAHQLWRTLGFGSYRTAWFMAHRIREGMREAHLPGGMGGEGKTVEADETYIGGKARNRAYREPPPKEAVMSLVERGGKVRSYHVPEVSATTLRPIIVEAIAKDSHFRTDESGIYWGVGEQFASHQTVVHSIGEYVRGDAHTNTVEGYFSIMKRGIYGVYHHVSQEHLKRYLCEFDFRYNYRLALGFTDSSRAELAVKGIAGKRLTYRLPHSVQEA
ncbi:MAG: IS1595 family transposase [Alphaproteobacteria bacterium]|nr:IS1595 family transposase [Alphaproteobacteria bacterium]